MRSRLVRLPIPAFLALLLLTGAAPALSAQAPPQPEPPPALDRLPALTPAITRAEIEHHVRFLASDELAGRFTGTQEAARAARYLAEALRASGVQPGGDAGTFLQKVPFERTRAKSAPELVVTPKQGPPRKAVYGADFDFPLGIAVATPALPLLVVRNEPMMPMKSDPAAALFLDGTRSDRRRILTKRGDAAANGWGLRVGKGRAEAGAPRPIGDGWSPAAPPRAHFDVWLELNGDLLEQARSGAIATLQLTAEVEREEVPAYNVIGVLRGTAEGKLGREAIVLSAHYDHLHSHADDEPGQAGPKPDLIFNGADDDASGCAAVLELAGHHASVAKPARTLVFLLATGEEIGLVGTKHYLDHPVVPLEHTVANLNFEMIGRPDEKAGGPGRLWFTGWDLTNLGAAFAEAQLPIAVDPRPDQNFFERSDNIAFVRRGIVGQTFSSYDLHADYHRVSDEADKLDYAHMEQCVRAAADAVGLVASGKVRPEWLPGKDPSARSTGGARPADEQPR